MEYQVKSPKKLIEVALPLDSINEASGKEKSIRQGHPSTLHLWWARRPLATARAVIFSQLVNDPSWKWELEHHGEVPPNNLKASWAASRKRLFEIIKELVKWENIDNQEILEKGRVEIHKSWREVCELNKNHPQAFELFNPDKLPGIHDPFAGGGTIPLEAQRLGLDAYASDLNPVAVIINKALIEIPPKFSGSKPVGPLISSEDDNSQFDLERGWPGSTGLAEDVRRYGEWIRMETHNRIGGLYPNVEITKELSEDRPDLKPFVGQKLPVIAWIWARTVKSPNPAFSHIDVPLASTFLLSSKEGKEVYVQPIVEGDQYKFTVRVGAAPKNAGDGNKLARGNFSCLLSKTPIPYSYIDDEANAKRMGQRLMAVVAEGKRGRVYLSPSKEMETIGRTALPVWRPETPCRGTFASNAQGRIYGFKTYGDYFTPRQLVALNTISDLIGEAREKIRVDAVAFGMKDDGKGLEAGGVGALAYAEAVCVYLAFGLGKTTDYNSSICTWISGGQTMRNTFGRQGIPMTWDFAEANPIEFSTGSFYSAIEQGVRVLRKSLPAKGFGSVIQSDAQTQITSKNKWISTDPPYYDNIGYADLSDYFYVWLRRVLKNQYPTLFGTIAVPKNEELVADSYRHGGKANAEAFFLSGMKEALIRLEAQAHPEGPMTIYYAFKQSETEDGKGTGSAGWETFLDAMNQAGFLISGTWPMRTELGNKVSGIGNNMLASSIILVCRKRPTNAKTVSRREFLRELNSILPEALDEMTKGSGEDRSPVAPVDFSQAIIGPGMAVFTKYSAVLEADGKAMSVHTALQLINRFLAEDDFDSETQFCLNWFDQNGWNEGRYGDAETLSRSKGTSVEGVKVSGVVESGGGKVRLLKWNEYPNVWNPKEENRNPVWETLHHLIRALKEDGESGAGKLLANTKGQVESVRQLAYRLYTLCERKGWTDDARAYNELITSWTGIETSASQTVSVSKGQLNIFGE